MQYFVVLFTMDYSSMAFRRAISKSGLITCRWVTPRCSHMISTIRDPCIRPTLQALAATVSCVNKIKKSQQDADQCNSQVKIILRTGSKTCMIHLSDGINVQCENSLHCAANLLKMMSPFTVAVNHFTSVTCINTHTLKRYNSKRPSAMHFL